MAWFTCTPIAFSGGKDFFCRDSGLICKSLQSLGFSCKSVMPLPSYPDDITDDLIRTGPENLTRSKWWKSISANKVVFYSWGHPQYTRIAQALRNCGSKVFVNLDSSGILPTTITYSQYVRIVTSKQIRIGGPFFGIPYGFVRSFYSRVYSRLFRDPGRIAHLKAATAIGCISPVALSLWRLWSRRYAPELTETMHLVPNPVADYIQFKGNVKKQDSVMAVGRWNYRECKRPALLAQVIDIVARHRGNTVFHIYGEPGKILNRWYANLQNNIKQRIHMHGVVDHISLSKAFAENRIGLCTSSHEGSHVASEEALCAGASIVAPMRPELNAMLWYVSNNSGRLSIDDSPRCLAETLLIELEFWDHGKRDPIFISDYWRSQLSGSAVVKKICNLLE